MARIQSRKIGRTHGGKSAEHLANGTFAQPYGIVMSGDSLILNMTDGVRMFNLILEPHETAELIARLTPVPAQPTGQSNYPKISGSCLSQPTAHKKTAPDRGRFCVDRA